MNFPEPITRKKIPASSNRIPFFAREDISDRSVLASYQTTFLLRASSNSAFHYWKECKRRITESFFSDEEELWSGGLNDALESTHRYYKTHRNSPTNHFPPKALLCLFLSNSGWWYLTFVLALIAFRYYFFVLNSTDVALVIGAGYYFLLAQVVEVTLWEEREPKHEMYVLSNSSFYIATKCAEEFPISNNFVPEWNVHLVTIPFCLIKHVYFDSILPEHVALKMLDSRIIYLHGFTEVDRACLRMHLENLGIKCVDCANSLKLDRIPMQHCPER